MQNEEYIYDSQLYDYLVRQIGIVNDISKNTRSSFSFNPLASLVDKIDKANNSQVLMFNTYDKTVTIKLEYLFVLIQELNLMILKDIGPKIYYLLYRNINYFNRSLDYKKYNQLILPYISISKIFFDDGSIFNKNYISKFLIHGLNITSTKFFYNKTIDMPLCDILEQNDLGLNMSYASYFIYLYSLMYNVFYNLGRMLSDTNEINTFLFISLTYRVLNNHVFNEENSIFLQSREVFGEYSDFFEGNKQNITMIINLCLIFVMELRRILFATCDCSKLKAMIDKTYGIVDNNDIYTGVSLDCSKTESNDCNLFSEKNIHREKLKNSIDNLKKEDITFESTMNKTLSYLNYIGKPTIECISNIQTAENFIQKGIILKQTFI